MDLTLIRSLIKAVQEAFEDADTEREYERWLNAKEEQQDSGEQV